MTDYDSITISNTTNCTQLIAELILDHFQIPHKENYLRLLTGLGRGVDEETICGAVLGGMYAINVIMSQEGASEGEIIKIQNRFKEHFRERYHAINCGDILKSAFNVDLKVKVDDRQPLYCGNLLDDSRREVIELSNLAIAAMDPIMARFSRI